MVNICFRSFNDFNNVNNSYNLQYSPNTDTIVCSKYKKENNDVDKSGLKLDINLVMPIINYNRSTYGLPKISKDDLLFHFKTIAEYPLHLDTLANKIFITPSTMLVNVYKIMEKKTNIVTTFNRGEFYFALNKNIYTSNNFLKVRYF